MLNSYTIHPLWPQVGHTLAGSWVAGFHRLDLVSCPYFFAHSSNSSMYLSKSDINNLSWITRYFSNSVSAWSFAISADTLPASCKIPYSNDHLKIIVLGIDKLIYHQWILSGMLIKQLLKMAIVLRIVVFRILIRFSGFQDWSQNFISFIVDRLRSFELTLSYHQSIAIRSPEVVMFLCKGLYNNYACFLSNSILISIKKHT